MFFTLNLSDSPEYTFFAWGLSLYGGVFLTYAILVRALKKSRDEQEPVLMVFFIGGLITFMGSLGTFSGDEDAPLPMVLMPWLLLTGLLASIFFLHRQDLKDLKYWLKHGRQE